MFVSLFWRQVVAFEQADSLFDNLLEEILIGASLLFKHAGTHQSHGKRVQGEHRDTARIATDQFAKALANLDSGVTVIAQGKDATRVLTTGPDQIGNAMHQHPCFAGTRTSEDQHIGGLPVVGNNLSLRLVVQHLDNVVPRFRRGLAR